MTDDRDALAERVRRAYAGWLGEEDWSITDAIIDIARAEADRARQEALEIVGDHRDRYDAGVKSDPRWDAIDLIVEALQRPQQPDKPAEARLSMGIADGEKQIAIPAPLSDAEILGRAAKIVERDYGASLDVPCEDDEVARALRMKAEELRALAQPAPDVDVFDAWRRADEEGYPNPREWFGPAIKALERAEGGCCACGVCIEARAKMASLRERARRVGR